MRGERNRKLKEGKKEEEEKLEREGIEAREKNNSRKHQAKKRVFLFTII